MIQGHVFIATSLDGYVARKNHQLDWLMKQNTSGEEHGYNTFIEGVDGLVMGRGSFETLLTSDDWPYSKPVIVMSQQLTEADIPPPLSDKVRLTDRSPGEVMNMLESEGWTHAYIDGGKIVQSFLRAGLINDMILTRIPILIGEGIPLFGALDGDIDLVHEGTQSFPSGLVTSHYRVAK